MPSCGHFCIHEMKKSGISKKSDIFESNQPESRIADPPKEPSSLGTYEPTYSCKSVCS